MNGIKDINMKVKYKASKEEIEMIKTVISEILCFWTYSIIQMEDGDGRAMSMSTETFFKQLERELQ